MERLLENVSEKEKIRCSPSCYVHTRRDTLLPLDFAAEPLSVLRRIYLLRLELQP